MELILNEALQKAVESHKAGQIQEAERLYSAILNVQPKHPDANHNLGVIAVSVDKADLALPLFKTALEANPKIEQFWLSYIGALIKEKQFDKAKYFLEEGGKEGLVGDKVDALDAQLKQITQSALPKSPAKKKSLTPKEKRKKIAESKQQKKQVKSKNVNSLGPSQLQMDNLLEHYQNGRCDEAEELAVSITQQYPKHQFGWKVLGALLRQTGRIDESLFAKHKAVELDSLDAEAHNNLGNTLQELGRLDEAEARCRQAIALKSDFAKAHYNLGITLQEQGRLDEAEASYMQAIVLKPDFAEAHSNLGNSLQELGRLGEAEASYRQAIAFKPDYIEAYSNLGNTLQELGRLGEAEASFTQAIALKPDYAEAYRYLALMKKFVSQDEQYSKMQELYLYKNISEEQRCHINFGLAKACEDLGEFEQAYTHYGEGNALRKKLLNYDINQDVELFRKIKLNYPRIAHNSLEPDKLSKNSMPIFIVGMMRSGTTLVEQIISSHSKVTGAGELYFAAQFGASIAQGLSDSNKDSILNFREKYLIKLNNISKGNSIVTDKMPQNFCYIGLLAAAFPEAKIVHVKRTPAAVCWANYKQYFASKNVGYCYSIDDILTYHKLYKNLMEFWDKRLSKRIYNLDYELLTVNQESETRQLIDYLGLDWDEKCLSPQNNTRSVATASNLQIREKVYQGSSQQWEKYQPFLNGAFDGLLSP